MKYIELHHFSLLMSKTPHGYKTCYLAYTLVRDILFILLFFMEKIYEIIYFSIYVHYLKWLFSCGSFLKMESKIMDNLYF